MAAIISAKIAVYVKRGDLFDESLTGGCIIDTDGKSFYAEVRLDQDQPIVLKFKESDGSLTFTKPTEQTFTLRFLKTATEMKIPLNQYQIAIVMGTAPAYEDKQTIIEGTFKVSKEITKKPLS